MRSCCTALCCSVEVQTSGKRGQAAEGNLGTALPLAPAEELAAVLAEKPVKRHEAQPPASKAQPPAALRSQSPGPAAEDDWTVLFAARGEVPAQRSKVQPPASQGQPPAALRSESPGPAAEDEWSVLWEEGQADRRASGHGPDESAGPGDGQESVLAHIGGAWRTEEAAEERSSKQRQRAQSIASAPQLCLDDVFAQPCVARAWSEDVFGTILHKPSGVRISPAKGISVDGVQYRLSPEDLELADGAVLGSGSGGVVQVGRHRPSGELVAVKTLRVGDDDVKREQMLKEIKSLTQTAGCPYLIQWYAGFADHAKGCVHVVLEYMDRGCLADLRAQLSGRGLPPAPTVCVAAQVLRGLRHLQLRLLLHRDVKPENILHDRSGRVKLADFGTSKDLARLPDCLSGTFVGTATYMAPERAAGDEYSFGSDVWSAGMVFYELAAGRYPYASASFVELYQALCEGPEPRLEADAFPAALRALVAACLTRDAAERPEAPALCEREPVAGVGDEHIAEFAAWLANLS